MVKRLCCFAMGVLVVSFLVPAMAPYTAAPYLEEKRLAVTLAAEAREILGEKILGVEYSETTTTVGHRDAKVLSQAPDFPALLVQWLHDAGTGEGDVVAINASGSFPALVVATLAAVEAVKAKPLLISSLGASSWGANRPDNTWAHMEKALAQRHPTWKSIATSLGGDGDRAFGMPDEGRRILLDVVRSSGLVLLLPESDEEVIAARLRLWKEHNGGQLPGVLVNVGGNQAFWGATGKEAPRTEGLLLPGDNGYYGDGVGKSFSRAGKPVIHLLGIKKIAARYGVTLPPDPASAIWQTAQPSTAARLCVLAFLFLAMLAGPRLIRKDL